MEKTALKYKLSYDLHTHTVFSHGKGTIEDNVIAAIGMGLQAIGISDHGPGHVTYGVKRDAFPVMRKEVDRLSVLYPEIKILLGVEANIINPSGLTDVSREDKKYLDFFLAGYHYGIFGEDKLKSLFLHGENWVYSHSKLVRKNTKVYNTELVVNAIYNNKVNVLTHPGDKGAFFMDEIAKACADTGTLLEISNWHKNLTVSEIRQVAKYDVKFIISSDAHSPEKVGTCDRGVERAKKANLDLSRIVNLEVNES